MTAADILEAGGYEEMEARLAAQRVAARVKHLGASVESVLGLAETLHGANQSLYTLMQATFGDDWAAAWHLYNNGALATEPEGEAVPRAQMTSKEFQKYLDRDGGRCVHCGTTEGLVPQHRAGRGMGGSRALNRPSNVIVLCATLNGLIESDAITAAWAHTQGWHLKRWQKPEETPVKYATESGRFFLLADDYTRAAC